MIIYNTDICFDVEIIFVSAYGDKMAKKITTALPAQTQLLVDAINSENPETTKMLINSAMKIIYPDISEFENNDVQVVVDMIRSMQPKDTVECILISQFIVCHLEGMKILSESYFNSKGHGMMMIRLSHSTLDQLERYRGKSAPTTNVNYNTLIQGNVQEKNGG